MLRDCGRRRGAIGGGGGGAGEVKGFEDVVRNDESGESLMTNADDMHYIVGEIGIELYKQAQHNERMLVSKEEQLTFQAIKIFTMLSGSS